MAYTITCDGHPLLYPTDDDFYVINPKVSLELNKIGEGSFMIYKNHPHFDKIKKLKSVFEIRDENGIVFRGRATGDSTRFDSGMTIDLEGALGYFNDSIVRPFTFPMDWMTGSEYWDAYSNGNVVEFFLKWLIDSHNAQVTVAQRFKLGRVTVADPNNNVTRINENYSTTWETLKSKLFESSLGGYLCIRYETNLIDENGNVNDSGHIIDYLADLEEVNDQEIVYGENLLDLSRETSSLETYSAIIPIGKDGLTIKKAYNPDTNVTDDIVQSGDVLYSQSGKELYGFIYAPVSETTWSDVTDADNLRQKGADWLAGRLGTKSAIEATAADLHFTDEEIQSFRIYKKVKVRSDPHGLSDVLPLTKLDLDLYNPQNTKILAGKTYKDFMEALSGNTSTEDRLTAAESQIADLMYKEITINEFTNDVKTARIGQTVSDITLSWVFSKDPVSVGLTDSIGDTVYEIGVSDQSIALGGRSIKSDTTWTLTATDERGSVATANTGITFQHGVYYGVGAARTAYDSDFVNSLSVDWRTSKKPSVSLSPANQHIYYCLPVWMGACTFTVGVFEGGFELADTISFTNEYGYTENYRIYKSVEALTGNITVKIS